jgi:glucose/arabinose dehydrogenase
MALPSGRVLGSVCIALCGMASAASALALDTQLVESGFSSPVFMTAPEGDSRLFVVERSGVIKVRSGGVWSTFLDISSQVDPTGERGLLGLAFDPNYQTNHTFYVNYIDSTPAHSTQIARFTGAGNVANTVGTPILSIAQPPGLSNHKAGWIGFRPGENNNLYIATGDGGGSNDSRPDPFDNNAQTTSSLLGKILRINVHPSNPNVPYGIPDNNPFAAGGGAPEVWDYGLRNPFRNSFDRATGNLIIADVGQGAREELDFESANSPGGVNYGWRLREGTIPTPTGGVGGDAPGATDPVFEYIHPGGANLAITGGYVYRGSLLQEIEGEYFFADSQTGQVWSLQTDPVTGALLPATLRDRTAELSRLNSFDSIVSFGEDGVGNLYMVDFAGNLLQIVPEPGTYVMLLFALIPLAWRMRRRTA